MMRQNIFIICEGQTEYMFIKKILSPYMKNYEKTLYPIPLNGVSRYKSIKKIIVNVCKLKTCDYVTTLIDYYGMPCDTPFLYINESNIYKKINRIEKEINLDIGISNFSFHFSLHEFEALLFSDPSVYEGEYKGEVYKVLENFPNPEYINNSVETAPSKRLIKIVKGYNKIRIGMYLAEKIGIEKMMLRCPHFRNWVDDLVKI